MIDRPRKFFVRPISLVTLTILLMGNVSWAQAPTINWSLDDAIRQIERQAKDFDTGMARFEMVRTADDGTELDKMTGTAFFNEDGRMRFNIDGGQQVIFVDRSTVSHYDAETSTVEEYSLNKHKDRLEPFTRLGFSTTGTDMKQDYLITIIGEEDIGDSRTVVMELTPERDKVRETVRLVRLSIDQASWMPVRQTFKSTKDGTTLTMTYMGMARNLNLKPELFKDKWPRGTKKVRK
jgi:outer membrane lipoprotein-sorting protein